MGHTPGEPTTYPNPRIEQQELGEGRHRQRGHQQNSSEHGSEARRPGRLLCAVCGGLQDRHERTEEEGPKEGQEGQEKEEGCRVMKKTEAHDGTTAQTDTNCCRRTTPPLSTKFGHGRTYSETNKLCI
jgi:hypothetical protein